MTNTDIKISGENSSIKTSLAPWFTIQNAVKAINFYKMAFSAVEVYRMEIPDDGGLAVRLSIDGAEFWISGESKSSDSLNIRFTGGDAIRMILTVPNPDELFIQVLNAGATEVFPVGEEYGWRLGRLVDPFGLHWEIGYPTT